MERYCTGERGTRDVNMIKLMTITAAALLCATLAQAQSAAVKEACKADVEKFCAGIKPGGGQLKDCMKPHRKEVSDECKAARKDAHDAKKAKTAI